MHQPGPGERSVRSARELLGVAADADAAQIARAYRRHAHRLHPDVSREPDVTEQFWTLQAAYRVALDAARGDVPEPPAQIVHRVPTVGLGAGAGGVAVTRCAPFGGVPWLVAGPVRVQPPERSNPRAVTTPTGERS